MPGRRALTVVVACGLVAFVAYEVGAGRREAGTIAFRWGGGKDGEAFYGMRVFEVKTASGTDVWATIEIGPGDGMWHDCGRIGRAASHEEAVRRFSVISWSADGVHVGSGSRDEYFLDRGTIEAHR